jgi:hypothetical protein
LGKLGQYDFPDSRFARAIDVVEKLCEPSYGGAISRSGLADMLQMKPKAGGFNVLLASLRDFGLVEGRDELKVTDLGKKIVAGTPEERERAKAESFLNVKLFKELFSRTGATVPEEQKFQVMLREITKEDPVKVRGQVKNVLGIYADGIRFLDVLKKPEMGGTIASGSQSQQQIPVPVPAEGQKFIEIKVGPYFQRLPYTPRGFDMAVALIQGLKEEETKSA